MAFTWKQRAFIDEYLIDFNATQAAIRAGYSEKTARQIGSKLLSIIDIKQEIKQRLDERAMSADEAIDRLTEMARGSLDEFYVWGEESNRPYFDLRAAKEAGKFHLIKKLKRDSSGKVEIELHDPKDAIDKLLKVHGSYAPNKHEHSGTLDIKLKWDE